jgi:hypothetical protein
MTIRIPFSHHDVEAIVTQEAAEGTEDLKSRVAMKVREAMYITSGNLPERVRAWIHQICLPHTSGLPAPRFTGKLAIPTDLSTLSNSELNGR